MLLTDSGWQPASLKLVGTLQQSTCRMVVAPKTVSSMGTGTRSELLIKEAERQRIDAFELWCWRRLLRVPWTIGRSNQSILKEIDPE